MLVNLFIIVFLLVAPIAPPIIRYILTGSSKPKPESKDPPIHYKPRHPSGHIRDDDDPSWRQRR